MSGLFGQSSATPAQGGLFNFNTGVQTNFGPSSQQPVTYSNLPLVDSKVLFSIKPPIPQALSTPSKLKPTEDSKKTPRSAAAQAARLNPRTAFRLYPTASSASGATSWRSQSSTKRLVVSDKDQTHHLSNANILEPEEKAAITDENNLYMTPSRSVLSHMPYSQLSAVSNFTVGCRGIGQVRFLCPVDLTKVVLDEILSKIVVFEPRQITVYPESDEDSAFTVSKPAVGSGLNLPAEVRLECCWPVNKANRQPIREMGDERMLSHISRLRSVEGTKFMDYFPETGTWVFRVEHFSTYRCPLSDKEINYELNDHSSSMSLGESLASSSSTIDSESNSCIIPLKKKHEDVQLKVL